MGPVAGRTFTARDAEPDAPPVVIVSERFVAGALRGASPVGRRPRSVPPSGEPGPWVEVVGVTPDLGMDAGDRTATGEVYTPLVGTTFMYVAVRTRGGVAAQAPALRQAVVSVDEASASPTRRVMWEVLRRSLLELGVGTVAGAALAALLSRALVILPFAIPGTVSVAIPLLAAAMLLSGVLASWVPARRALRIQPVEALRAE